MSQKIDHSMATRPQRVRPWPTRRAWC